MININMDNKTTRKPYNRIKTNQFKEQWGMDAKEIAAVEGCTPEAIRIRVKKYGDPFYRRITAFEKKWGCTAEVLAEQYGITTIAMYNRIQRCGTPSLEEYNANKSTKTESVD